MASTYSPSLRLELIGNGEQSGTWGTTTNTNLGTLLEQAIAGFLSKAQGDVADLTLTSLDGAADEARNMVIDITGALTAGRNVIVPTAEKIYLFKNSTTGGFAITVKTAAGTGVAIAAGTSQWVYCDGTNVVQGLSGTMATQAAASVAITGGTIAGLTTFTMASGAATPATNDAAALGTSTLMWSDLFLASGGVINFNNGDVTITHAANTLTFGGASSGYAFTGGPVVPATNDAAALGTTALMWSDLFLASGAVINFNNGDITLTHAANTLTFTGGAFVVDSGGTVDFSAATEFKVPVSAAPTVNANGEVALDTTVTDWSHGIMKYYGGEELGIVAMPIAEFAGMTNGQVPTYNATTDEFEMTTPSSGPTLDTAQATTSGTTKDFSIPAGTVRITVILNDIGINAAGTIGIQIGDSGGIENSGYVGTNGELDASPVVDSATTDRWVVVVINQNASTCRGHAVLTLANGSNTWIQSGVVAHSAVASLTLSGGSKTLTGELTTVRLIGSGTFDAGAVNVIYE